jgi:RNA methyltransferase, TrmH family
MLSKSLSQLVRSLHQKKFRQQEGLFLVENAKSVQEVLNSDFQVEWLLCTEAFYKENAPLADRQRCRVEMASPDELTRLGTLESNNAAIALVRMRPAMAVSPAYTGLTLVLDDVRDPGNLGTLLRIADWYGVGTLLCTPTTADIYNPKVISASKGSFTRIQWWYGDVASVLKTTELPVLGTFLDGQDVHALTGVAAGYVVMGNEATGIGPALESLVTQRITIPRYGAAESLNVGIAAAVVLDNLRRLT